MSQSDLAEKAGVSQATISRLENAAGDVAVDLRTVHRLSAALRIPVSALIPPREEVPDRGALPLMMAPTEHDEFWVVCTNPMCSDNEIIARRGAKPEVVWAWDEFDGGIFEQIQYCSECGGKLLKCCPKCGKWFDRGDTKYCMRCGTRVIPELSDETLGVLVRRKLGEEIG